MPERRKYAQPRLPPPPDKPPPPEPLPPFRPLPAIDYSDPYVGAGESQWSDYARRIMGVAGDPATGEELFGADQDFLSGAEFDSPEWRAEVDELSTFYGLSEEEAMVMASGLSAWLDVHADLSQNVAEALYAETLKWMRREGLSQSQAERTAYLQLFPDFKETRTVARKKKPVVGGGVSPAVRKALQGKLEGQRASDVDDEGPGWEPEERLDPARVRWLKNKHRLDAELAEEMARLLPDWIKHNPNLTRLQAEEFLARTLQGQRLGMTFGEAKRAALERVLGIGETRSVARIPSITPKEKKTVGGGNKANGFVDSGEQVEHEDVDAYNVSGMGCPPPTMADVRRAGTESVRRALLEYIHAPIDPAQLEQAKRELLPLVHMAQVDVNQQAEDAASVSITFAQGMAEFESLKSSSDEDERDRAKELATALRPGRLMLLNDRIAIARRLLTESANLENLKERIARLGDRQTRSQIRWTICKYRALIGLSHKLANRAGLATRAIADTEAVRLNRAHAHDAAWSVHPLSFVGWILPSGDEIRIEPYVEIKIGDIGIKAERSLEDKIPTLVGLVTGYGTFSKYLLTGDTDEIRKALNAQSKDIAFNVQSATWDTISKDPIRSSEIAAGLGTALVVLSLIEAAVATRPLAVRGLIKGAKGLKAVGGAFKSGFKALLRDPSQAVDLLRDGFRGLVNSFKSALSSIHRGARRARANLTDDVGVLGSGGARRAKETKSVAAPRKQKTVTPKKRPVVGKGKRSPPDSRTGSIRRSLGADSRAEAFARRYRLNINSPTTRQVLNSLDDPVERFVAQFRRGRIWRELPGEIRGMTVGEALGFSSKVRKLLIDRRFAK